MYKQCQTELSAARQRELEQGLLQVMLRQNYEGISVSDLCRELQVPRKAFYRYFSGKDGALHALIDHALMDYNVYASVDQPEKIQKPVQYMEKIFVYWFRQRPLLDALEKSGLSGILVQRAVDYTTEMDTIPRFMEIHDRRLREYGTMFMVCGLMTMIVRWHHDGFSRDAKEMARLAMDLLTQPLFSGNVEDI